MKFDHAQDHGTVYPMALFSAPFFMGGRISEKYLPNAKEEVIDAGEDS